MPPKSEIIKQGATLQRAGIFSRRQGDHNVAYDARSHKFISMHVAETRTATFKELGKYYSAVRRRKGEDEQTLAYRAAEVRALWNERTEQCRRQARRYMGKHSRTHVMAAGGNL